jgi:hypothetical protein
VQCTTQSRQGVVASAQRTPALFGRVSGARVPSFSGFKQSLAGQEVRGLRRCMCGVDCVCGFRPMLLRTAPWTRITAGCQRSRAAYSAGSLMPSQLYCRQQQGRPRRAGGDCSRWVWLGHSSIMCTLPGSWVTQPARLARPTVTCRCCGRLCCTWPHATNCPCRWVAVCRQARGAAGHVQEHWYHGSH